MYLGWTGAGETFRVKSFNHQFLAPDTYTFTVTVSCYPGITASDTVQIVIRERLPGWGAVGPEPEGEGGGKPAPDEEPTIPSGGQPP